MANKADRFYYENFIEAADCACKAADYLVECLTAFDPQKMETILGTIHEFENAADKKKHEMSNALARAFVTPLDREDLAVLSQNIDEVSDKIEEVIQQFYVDQITTVTEDAVLFAQKISHCCHLMRQLLLELESFKKKPEHLRSLIIEVNNAEEECDAIYLQASLKARNQGKDVLEIVAWRAIYACMENCADACEHVADSIETIVMKNT